jgi:hypothetical protein
MQDTGTIGVDLAFVLAPIGMIDLVEQRQLLAGTVVLENPRTGAVRHHYPRSCR